VVVRYGAAPGDTGGGDDNHALRLDRAPSRD
jgi:hypothetical protein